MDQSPDHKTFDIQSGYLNPANQFRKRFQSRPALERGNAASASQDLLLQERLFHSKNS